MKAKGSWHILMVWVKRGGDLRAVFLGGTERVGESEGFGSEVL